jgi:DNA-binding GntR family transcriptional regulator
MPEIDPPDNREPAYGHVASAIAARIQAGEFTGRLPAERDLAWQYGVAYQTLRHGIDLLRTHGLVITRQGRGTFVAPPYRPDPSG